MEKNKSMIKQNINMDPSVHIKDATQGLSKKEVAESIEELKQVAKSDEVNGTSSATYDEY